MSRLLGVAGAVLLAATASSCAPAGVKADPLHQIEHIVVLYQENHSFDSLRALARGLPWRCW